MEACSAPPLINRSRHAHGRALILHLLPIIHRYGGMRAQGREEESLEAEPNQLHALHVCACQSTSACVKSKYLGLRCAETITATTRFPSRQTQRAALHTR